MKIHQTSLITLLFGLIFAQPVLAAELRFENTPDKNLYSIGLNQTIEVKLIIDTENLSINAIESQISYDISLLELTEIQTGDSIINFWIKEPSLEKEGLLSFSGIITNGLKTTEGKILSLILKTRNEGQAGIKILSAQALLNNGQATPAELKKNSYQIKIVQTSAENQISSSSPSSQADYYPPEPFNTTIARDQNLHENKFVIIFSTQDKNSGIDHYEVKEGEQDFTEAKSPYVLKNQNLDENIVVRAYDKAGNSRDSLFYAPNKVLETKSNYLPTIFGALSIVLLILLLLRLRKILKNKTRMPKHR